MQIEAGQFIASLRNKLAAKLTDEEEPIAILGAFDRACVEALTSETRTPAPASKAVQPNGQDKKKSASEAMKRAWKKRKAAAAKAAAEAQAEREQGEIEADEDL
jgi:hypothetical protein